MVSKQVNKRPAVNNTETVTAKKTNSHSDKVLAVSLVCLFVAIILTLILVFLLTIGVREPADETTFLGWCPTLTGEMVNSDECDYGGVGVKKIDFQSVVDNWVSSVGGKKGIAIYDLDANELVGAYNADEKFATASIYKLFVVYEVYRRLQSGEWDQDDAVGWTGFSTLECLDLAIRESYSPCAELLWARIGREELDNVVQEKYNLPNVRVGSFAATPMEVMKMMRKFYYHKEIVDDDLVNTMTDSFLNQPVTTYDWRQGLPSGFSDKVAVYNKVGWESDGSRWKIYDDAAIIKFVNEKRNFIVVVMTSGVDSRQIRRFGSELEQSFYEQF